MIPYGRQTTAHEELQALEQVLDSQWLTQGPKVAAFEEALAQFCNVKHGVAVANGTAALHIACLALGLGANDYLWTSPNSFVASANCGRYCGATVDFIDIDPETRNLSINSLQQKLLAAERNNQLPKVLVVVHFAGYPADMAAISQLSQQYDFKVIEDAAHALGSRRDDDRVGDCRYSDITTFSFHPVKTLTTGEGGMAVTNNPQLAQKLRSLRSHGIEKHEPTQGDISEDLEPWYYQQQTLGFNYRLTDLQAAIGLVQLSRLEEFISQRRSQAAIYNEAFKDLPLKLIKEANSIETAWHLYVIECIDEVARLKLYKRLRVQQ
ncbi:MAG: UDP-4-amino-4,6-dideoxy-N-acetyl-beta-L-altrosamine transaminase, partial [Oceanicoccus sp.]